MRQFFILRSRVQQEYNSFLVNALNHFFKSNLSLNNFKWLLTKLGLSCVWSIIPRSRKCLWNEYPALNQELQNHDPVGRHIPVYVMYGSTPPPPPGLSVVFRVWQVYGFIYMWISRVAILRVFLYFIVRVFYTSKHKIHVWQILNLC